MPNAYHSCTHAYKNINTKDFYTVKRFYHILFIYVSVQYKIMFHMGL